MIGTMLIWLLTVLCFLGVQSSGQEERSADNAVVEVCTGANVTFTWGVNSTLGEIAARKMKWVVEGEASNITVATYSTVGGVFAASPAYSQRVAMSEDGIGVTIRKLTIPDSGRYSLWETDDHWFNESTATVTRQVELTVVADGLASSDRNLHAKLESEALWDNVTDQWMVRLSCGNFSFSEQPQFDVTWTIPTGETFPSNTYSQGQFYFHLFPPVLSGRYSCSLPQQSFVDACIPTSGGPQGDGKLESHVRVEENLARLLVLEADYRKLKAENQDLEATLTHLKAQMQTREAKMRGQAEKRSEEMRKMKEEGEKEEEELRTLREGAARARGEVVNLRGMVESEEKKLSGRVERMTEELDHLGTNVAFMTKMSRDVTLESRKVVKLEDVRYNEGNAYHASAGMFTAPVSGTYHFFVKTENKRRHSGALVLYKEGRVHLLYTYVNDNETPGGSVVTLLHRGQRVWLETGWPNQNHVTSETTLGGFLVRPDPIPQNAGWAHGPIWAVQPPWSDPRFDQDFLSRLRDHHWLP